MPRAQENRGSDFLGSWRGQLFIDCGDVTLRRKRRPEKMTLSKRRGDVGIKNAAEHSSAAGDMRGKLF